jgi:quinol monooxygenase YgiN
MFARLTFVDVKRDSSKQATALYEKSVIPAMRQKKGYCGAFLLADDKSGKSITVSLWENELDAVSTEKDGHVQQQLAKFKNLFSSKPRIEGYTVFVHDKA